MAALAAAVIAVLILVFTGGPQYTVNADFADAGQLVSGDLVEVGGVPIGQIGSIGVTNNGEADIVMNITDGRFVPLRLGTSATIRAAGAAGIANRYISIAPGPSGAPAIPDDGVLPATDTRGIVDLDMLLDAFDAPTRERLQSIVSNSALAFGAPHAASRDFAFLDPALSQTSLLGAELVRFQPALSSVIASTASTLQALDSRRADLDNAVSSLASLLRTIAGQRTAVADILQRTTGVLSRLEVTFGGLRATLPVVGGMFEDARPAVAPLLALLRRVVPDSEALVPTLAALRAQLPPTQRSLAGLPELARLAVPALSWAQAAIAGATPIFTGLRPYTLDWMAGAITLIGSVQYAYYDELGHYARETILGGQESLEGLASIVPQITVPSPTAPTYRTGLLARCPGGAAEPAPDHSNPWIPEPSVCNPADDHK